MKKLTALLLALVMMLSLAACSGGADETTAPPETTAPVETTEAPVESTAAPAGDVTVMGEGATVFTFTVVDLDGNETVFEIHTDKTVVGEALQELGLISGEVGEWGLMVDTVNGVTADWDADGTYWAFYINGEYAMTGVDVTDIDATAAYSMVLTKG